MKKQRVRPNPAPMARFFPAFEVGGHRPTSRDRARKQAFRRLRLTHPKRRAGFTKPPKTDELAAQVRNHYQILRWMRDA